MANITPFNGIRYSQLIVKLEDVVAPPYDVISTEQQNDLYEASPYNVVRLILGREEDRYASAARHYKQWLDEKILIRDQTPALYLLAQTFTGEDGKHVVRKGFIGACELVDLDKGIVLPHEKTLSKPKADRLNLMTAAAANFSQIFGLYADPDRKINTIADRLMQGEPHIDVEFENVRNRIWPATAGSDISLIRNIMQDKKILIADGHHRYETALAYRDQRKSQNPAHTGQESYNFVMMFFTNMYDEGLVIYPTHRLLHSLPAFDAAGLLQRLGSHYTVETISDPGALRNALAARSSYAFGLALHESLHLVYLRNPEEIVSLLPPDMPPVVRALDVALLHSHILGKVLNITVEAQEQKLYLDYSKDFNEAIGAVESGRVQAAFLMNPTPIRHVRDVAEAGYTMPQKSTYFFPKLISGLLINPLN